VTGLPWGIEYLGAVRHPIPLYESLLGIALFLLVRELLHRRPPAGQTALLTALAYLSGRAALDLLRAPDGQGADPRLLGGFTLTQAVALVLVPALLAALLARSPVRKALSAKEY